MVGSPVNMIVVTGVDESLVAWNIEHATTRLMNENPGAVTIPLTSGLSGLFDVSLFDPFTCFTVTDPNPSDTKTLLTYLENPPPDTTVVVGLHKPNNRLMKAVTGAPGGVVIDVGGKKPADRVMKALSTLPLTGVAKRLITQHVGEDVDAAVGLVRNLTATPLPPSGVFDVTDVEPWLGDAGGVPVWDLLDCVDRGDTTAALDTMRRVLHGAGVTPLSVVASLKTHFERIYLVGCAGIRDENEARTFLGYKSASTYPAKKAINLAGRYGTAAATGLELVAKAEAALKGGEGRGVPPLIVIELLVMRLCTMPRQPLRG